MLSSPKWLALLSLDAPQVAVTWQALLARTLGSSQSPRHYLLVFASVWLGYAADRRFDNRRVQRPQSEQHPFYAQRPRAVPSL